MDADKAAGDKEGQEHDVFELTLTEQTESNSTTSCSIIADAPANAEDVGNDSTRDGNNHSQKDVIVVELPNTNRIRPKVTIFKSMFKNKIAAVAPANDEEVGNDSSRDGNNQSEEHTVEAELPMTEQTETNSLEMIANDSSDSTEWSSDSGSVNTEGFLGSPITINSSSDSNGGFNHSGGCEFKGEFIDLETYTFRKSRKSSCESELFELVSLDSDSETNQSPCTSNSNQKRKRKNADDTSKDSEDFKKINLEPKY